MKKSRFTRLAAIVLAAATLWITAVTAGADSLRSAIAAAGPDDETVYRYDRQALLDALARRIGGGRA